MGDFLKFITLAYIANLKNKLAKATITSYDGT